MGAIELFLIGIGLSMDAFAVSVCKGLSVQKTTLKEPIVAGLWFGGFQALMPTLGFFCGNLFADKIEAFDHWIAFGLLLLIGANMIKESLSKDDEKMDSSFGFKTMLIMAIATSIDALAVGVSFAFMKVNIWLAVAIIGVTTFILSGIGIKVGSIFGTKYKSKAEFVGGAVLIIIGIKTLIEGLFV